VLELESGHLEARNEVEKVGLDPLSKFIAVIRLDQYSSGIFTCERPSTRKCNVGEYSVADRRGFTEIKL